MDFIGRNYDILFLLAFAIFREVFHMIEVKDLRDRVMARHLPELVAAQNERKNPSNRETPISLG